MALETATYIADLNAANPTGTDPVAQGDDHLRLIKAVLQTTFPDVATSHIKATTNQATTGTNDTTYMTPKKVADAIAALAPGGTTLTVKELDGSPSIAGVTEIKFDQSTGLAVTNNTGGSVTISASGGGSAGSTVKSSGVTKGTGVTTLDFSGFIAAAVSGVTGTITWTGMNARNGNTGTEYTAITKITFTGSAITTSVSGNTLTVTAADNSGVTVKNNGGTGAVDTTLNFTKGMTASSSGATGTVQAALSPICGAHISSAAVVSLSMLDSGVSVTCSKGGTGVYNLSITSSTFTPKRLLLATPVSTGTIPLMAIHTTVGSSNPHLVTVYMMQVSGGSFVLVDNDFDFLFF